MIKKIKEYSVINLISALISFLQFYIVTKLQIDLIGIEKRGHLILIQSGVFLISSISRVGINQSVLHELSVNKNRKIISNYYLLSLLQLILFFILVFFTLKLNILFKEPITFITLHFIFYLVAYYIYQTFIYFSFYLLSIWKHFIITLLFNLLNIILFYFFNSEKTLNTVFVNLAASHILVSVILFFFLPKFSLSDVNYIAIKKLLKNGLKIFGWSVFKDLIYKVDIFLFSNKISQNEFGIYTIIRDLLFNIWRIFDPIISSVTKAYAEANSKISSFKRFIYLYLLFAIFSAPIIIFLSIYYIKYYLKIDTKILESNIYIFLFAFSLLFFVVWKTIASLNVINNINKPVYLSIILFFFSLGIQYIYIVNLNLIFLAMSVSYTIATLFLISEFNKYNNTKT